MARSSPTVTAQEIQYYQQFALDSGLVLDGSDGEKNAELLGTYIVQELQSDITPASLSVALKKVGGLIFKSKSQRDYEKVAAENPAAASALLAQYPRNLSSEPDEKFANMALLLVELRGRTVDTQRIHEAIGRINYRPGKRLSFAPAPVTHNPLQHADDGEPFLGRDINLAPWQRKQQERERQAKENSTQADAAAILISEARREAEGLRGRTHSETEEIQNLTFYEGVEVDWVATLSARKRLWQKLENRWSTR